MRGHILRNSGRIPLNGNNIAIDGNHYPNRIAERFPYGCCACFNVLQKTIGKTYCRAYFHGVFILFLLGVFAGNDSPHKTNVVIGSSGVKSREK